jgi:cobalt-zinc-cadmium resistance protein CzcA
VVVGGMLVGPVLLLVVVPALQTLFLDWKGRRSETAVHEDEPDLAEV